MFFWRGFTSHLTCSNLTFALKISYRLHYRCWFIWTPFSDSAKLEEGAEYGKKRSLNGVPSCVGMNDFSECVCLIVNRANRLPKYRKGTD